MNTDTKRLIGIQKIEEAISYNLKWFGYQHTIELCEKAISRIEQMRLVDMTNKI